MNLQAFLDQKHISKYALSKVSGVPKTTIMDICAGRSDLSLCTAKTVHQIARALDCSMEEIMEMAQGDDSEIERPENKSHYECNLPDFLAESIAAMKAGIEKLERGEKYYDWDCDFCDLQASINQAEACQLISSEQAWYLREKYLQIERTT